MNVWIPSEDWGVVQDIDSSDRVRTLPDGRQMRESQITLSPQAMQQIFSGYRCARCLEYDMIRELGAFPEQCPVCNFPMKAEQTKQLEQDFVGEARPGLVSGLPMDREREFLEREHYEKKGYA